MRECESSRRAAGEGGGRYPFKLMECRNGTGDGFALKRPLIHCKYTQRIFVSLYFYVHTISILPRMRARAERRLYRSLTILNIGARQRASERASERANANERARVCARGDYTRARLTYTAAFDSRAAALNARAQ
jgi:hypothetical protein